jgi:excisionase family DNA binding protein
MPRPIPSAPLIDIDQVAARLGVTPRFVRRLVDERRIPFHKIGKFVRFDPADIDSYIVRGRVESASL